MTLEKCDILTIKSYASAIRVGSLPKRSGKFTENGELYSHRWISHCNPMIGLSCHRSLKNVRNLSHHQRVCGCSYRNSDFTYSRIHVACTVFRCQLSFQAVTSSFWDYVSTSEVNRSCALRNLFQHRILKAKVLPEIKVQQRGSSTYFFSSLSDGNDIRRLLSNHNAALFLNLQIKQITLHCCQNPSNNSELTI